MKYIIIPMAVIITLFLFGLFYNGETFDSSISSTYTTENTNGTFTEDGEEHSISTEGEEYNFEINETQGLIAVLIAVSVVASLIGIRVLGSGFSETTIKILYNTTFFYGTWGLFSALSFNWFLIIPFGLGWIIFFILTGILSFGIVQQINKG